MTLGQKQRLFSQLIGLFILEAYRRGYQLSFGEARRSDEQAEINAMGPGGRANLVDFIKLKFPVLADKIKNNTGSGIRFTLHELGLAMDFNLFKDGQYLSETEDWRELGEWWEQQHSLCRWGGRFNDGNHLSLEHEGKK